MGVTSREIDDFVKTWLVNHSNGDCQTPQFKCCIHDFENIGRGMKSTCHINPNETILKLPVESCLITVDTVLNDRIIKKFLSSTVPEDHSYKFQNLFIIFLVCHRARKYKSPWFPYLNSLPQSYSTCNTWLHEHIDQLEPYYHERVMLEIEEQWEEFSLLREALSVTGVLMPGQDQNLDFIKDYLWAYNTIKTRCFSAPEIFNRSTKISKTNSIEFDFVARHMLAPYIDMINHCPALENCDVEFDAFGYFRVYATKNIKPGEQIFLSYDPEETGTIMRNYGFVDTYNKNPHERIFFNASDFTTDTEKLDIILEEYQLDSDMIKRLHISRDLGITVELQKTALIAVLSDNELKHKIYEDYLDGSSEPPQGRQDKANELIKNVIYKKLKYYQDRLEKSELCSMLKQLARVQVDFIQEFLEKRLSNTENIKNGRQFFTIQYVLANMSKKSAYLEPDEDVDVIPISGGRLIYA